MRVVALERDEGQLALVAAAPAKDQAEVLHELLDRLEEDPNPIERLVEDYLAGDMTRVFREIEGRIEKEPAARAYKKAFLDDRNHRLVQRLVPLMERGKAFVAAGPAHLPRAAGMLHLLGHPG